MIPSRDRLDDWVRISQVISHIAVPVVLGLVGWIVQSTLADAGLKKDYVQMALAVLKDPPTDQNKELRKWAISVLDKHSPVPLPDELKDQLRTSPAWFSMAKESIDVAIECVPTPGKDTVDWLLKAFPYEYTRCPNPAEIGQRVLKGLGTPYVEKWPSPAASGAK